MKRLDWYIIKKFLGTFFYAISLLAIIIIIFDISEKADDFLDNKAPVKEIIFDYYINFLPYFINLFSALFTFISVIFFTSKMAYDTEIIAILSSGISFKRMMFPFMFSAVFLAILSSCLANFVIPNTNKAMLEFEYKYIKDPRNNKENNIHMQVSPDTYIYAESYSVAENRGHRFSIEQYQGRQLKYKLTSSYALWDSIKQTWQLHNFVIRRLDSIGEKITSGPVLDTTLALTPADFSTNIEDLKTMDYWELNQFIKKEKLKGSPNIKEYEVEKHKRLSGPFSTIILTLIGVALSSRKVRGGIGLNLGIGITITFAYVLFMQVSTVFATFGSLTPALAAWLPNILFGILSAFLIKIAPK